MRGDRPHGFATPPSSLDSESEQLIQRAVERLLKGRTAIVIAHRLSTVRALDRILVFDQGRIVEDGPHGELMGRPGGRYRHLFERRMGDLPRRRRVSGIPSPRGAAKENQ